MRNELKRQSFCGSKVINVLNNGVKIWGVRDFIFEPNKVVDTEDFDLSSWVKLRYLIEIKDEVKDESIIDEYGEKIEDIDLKNVEDEKEDEFNEQVISKEIDEVVIDNKEEDTYEDENEDENEEEEDDSDIEKNDIKYEMVEDGFKCTICGKVLKSEKRMSTHIRKKHSELESN